MRLIFFVLSIFASTHALAQDDVPIFVQTLSDGTAQEWFTRKETTFAAGVRTTLVVSRGNAGLFWGELYVDCPNPAASRWLTFDNALPLASSDVPRGAILAIRSKLCALS